MPVDKKTGMVRPDDIIKEIIPTTCLVTIMLANNETGVIQPIKSIFEKIRQMRSERPMSILTHTDAAQAFGKIPVSVQDLDVDYMTIVGHKVCMYIEIQNLLQFFNGKQCREDGRDLKLV